MKIRKGDLVEVIAGDFKGARGEVQRIVRDSKGRTRVVVAGINLIKKHQRRTGDVRTQFGIIEREAPLDLSNVMLVCPQSDKPTRVGHEIRPDGTKVRVSKRAGVALDE